MIRLRWTDPQMEDRAAPVDWRIPSLVTATLFLNFGFWSISPLYGGVSGLDLVWLTIAMALFTTALFFLGPAISAQAIQGSLFDVAAASFGSIGAFGLRVVCVFYLVIWLAALTSTIVRVGVEMGSRRFFSPWESGLAAAATLLFLFGTALLGLDTNAKLAAFTNKLALALLAAALIRVRSAIPIAWEVASHPNIAGGWQNFAYLSYYAAPLMVFAAAFGRRCRTPKQVLMIGGCGFALPIIVSLVGASVTVAAGYLLHLTRPSLGVTISGILTHGVSERYLYKQMALIAITMFGLIRFGAWAMVEALPGFRTHRILRICVLGFSVILIAVLSSFLWDFSEALDPSTQALAAAAAVLTADAIARRWRKPQSVRFDWIGVIALGLGFQAPFCLPVLIGWFPDPWWHPWLLPSYAISFTACLVGRALEKLLRVANHRPSPV